MTSWSRLASGSALAALAVSAAFIAPASAQDITASTRGSVVGADGAPVAGAQILVTHLPSGTRSSVRSNAGGTFFADGLRPGGPYKIEVIASGFASATFEDAFIVVGSPLDLEVVLQSATTETIVVQASRVSRARVDGSTSRLNRAGIEGTATPTRDIRDLARRSPFATANSVGDGGISIAGSNPRTNRITIDGVAAQDDFGLNTGGLPTRRGPVSIDAISQIGVSPAPSDVRNGGFLGGAIDIVLRSGDNDFDGTLRGIFRPDNFSGDSLEGVAVPALADETNYSAFFSGPIIKDRLFFALAYENYESSDVTARGPVELGVATIVGPTGNSMTLADIASVTNIFTNTYRSNYPFGSIPATKPILDEKYSARLDWNINEDHRLAVTYRNADSTVFNFTNLGTTTASLDSMWYFTGEVDESYSAQLNSDWTDDFSTELRVSRRDYTRLQEPPAGQQFADITVCTTPTAEDTTGTDPLLNCRNAGGSARGTVRFGADQFRHANYLSTVNNQAQFEARYRGGDLDLKVGVQYQERDVFNLFVQDSDGVYYFDSLADFTAGRANRLIYRNAPSGNANDGAARFTYSIATGYIQNTWTLSDTLRVTAGLRYDRYGMDEAPAVNQNFVARNGITNARTYSGLDILMPRASLTWDATDSIEVKANIGLYSGGLPDVFLSNSFSNNGVSIVGPFTIVRRADGTFAELGNAPAFTQAIGAAALNGLVGPTFGTTIPAGVQSLVSGGTPNPNNETNSIAPNYEVPAEWKFNVATRFSDLPFGVEATVDAVFSRVATGYAFRDLAVRPLTVNGVQAMTPDGRMRYDGLSAAQRTSIPGTVVNSSTTPLGQNRDIQLYSLRTGDLGQGFVLSFGLEKEFDFGLNLAGAYTYSNLEELNSSGRFSSTANSLYNGAFSSFDPNAPVYGEAQEEIESAWKFSADWTGTPLFGLETRFSLVADVRDGRPFNFVMNAGTGRNATFGVNKGGQLAYIPDFSGALTQLNPTTWVLASDPRVAFDSQATALQVQQLVNAFGLPQGQIVPRSFNRNDSIELVDLVISQEIPTFLPQDRAFVNFEISNLLNMINDEWGLVQEFGDTQTLYSVSCAGADGIADNDGVLSCNRYRINTPSNLLTNAPTRRFERSLWTARINLKYEF